MDESAEECLIDLAAIGPHMVVPFGPTDELSPEGRRPLRDLARLAATRFSRAALDRMVEIADEADMHERTATPSTR